MGRHLADVSVEDIEQALQPEPAPSRFQRTILDVQGDISRSMRAFARSAFPHRLWIESLPNNTIRNAEPHTLPEEARP